MRESSLSMLNLLNCVKKSDKFVSHLGATFLA